MEVTGNKDSYDFVDYVKFDGELSSDSVFPEWIKSGKLELERLTSGRVPERKYYNIVQDEGDIDEYFTTSYGFPDNISKVTEYFETIDDAWKDKTYACYGIFKTSGSNKFIGQATVEKVSFDKQKCEIGVWLRKEYWGNGYSQKRAELLCEVAFSGLDLDVVEVTVTTENIKSVKAVEKYMDVFGGEFNGKIRKDTLTPGNGVQNVYKWSVTKEEFYSEDSTYSRTINLPSFDE